MLDNKAYEQFRDNMRRLAEARIAPFAAECDRDSRFPEEALEAFKQMDLVALAFDEAIGGQGADTRTQAICLEELGRVCATSSLTLMVIWAGLVPIARNGSKQLREEVVRPAIKGDIVASICLTEPRGGSDLWGLQTKAERQNGEWVLKGQKRFISNATRSDWYTVLARTDEKSFAIFAVHKDDPGLTLGERERKLGIRGSPTADVILENCRIPEHRCIGEPDQAYRYMTESLGYTRILIAAQALGIAQGAFDQAVGYTSEREQFGQKVSHFQMIRGSVGAMATKIEASRQLLYHAADAVEEEEPRARTLASMAKLFCSDVAMEVATEAVQLHGGAGYLSDLPVERMMRDAKITQIYEGTNEIQKLIIAKDVYGH